MKSRFRSLCQAGLLGTSIFLPLGVQAKQEAPASTSPTETPSATVPPATVLPAGPAAVPGVRTSAAPLLAKYERALAAQKLAPSAPLSSTRLAAELLRAETKLADGRTDEVIDDLVYIVESERFLAFADSAEGRGARYYLGEALGRGGVYSLAIHYLAKLVAGNPSEIWFRRAVRSLVDFGLESATPGPFLDVLAKVSPQAPAELRGDIAYLEGRALEQGGKPAPAFDAYQRVRPEGRFWAQATYLSGLIAVDRGQYRQGERLFCKVADPKQTPRSAPIFGGNDFFRVRDLARLGLGRVAHEQYRFDDARYYYFLVPHDSEHLPEALYETATTRYEAKDYKGARESLDELKGLARPHVYADEAWILDAYVDLALCNFPRADASLRQFLKRYEPVRDAARRLIPDPGAMRRLALAVERGTDPATAGLGVPAETARALGSLLRVDLGYGQAVRRAAELEYQLRGLRAAMQALDEARRALVSPGETKPNAGKPGRDATGPAPVDATHDDEARRVETELDEVRRLLREASANGKSGQETELEEQLRVLEVRFRAEKDKASAARAAPRAGDNLLDLIAEDRDQATDLHAAAEKLREELRQDEVKFAKAALTRLDLRLSRLLARARLGRIETVLGKKRSLEMGIEALSQGLLPHTIVDSLDAARYLEDDEEYWPFDGEDWEDEYVGGEGLE